MKRATLSFTVLAVALLLLSTTASATIVYVKWDSPGPTFDGTSWNTAFHTVQSGLNAASIGDEVWVAKGTYRPTSSTDRTISISLRTGVGLYGGFAGMETEREQRDWRANECILTGDIGVAGRDADNSYHVVVGADDAVLDGFRITGGNANGSGFNNRGGGLYCSMSSPAIANNTITENTASDSGAGVYVYYATPTIVSNKITANSSAKYAGGIYCNSSSVHISNNHISGNIASQGGGVYSIAASPTISNNTIVQNTAASVGGGIYCGSLSPTIANNTISNNIAPTGGGIYCNYSSPSLSNNIVAFNLSGVFVKGGSPAFRSNCVYGNMVSNYSGLADPTGTNGNIADDPRLAGQEYGNTHIRPDSPCVDAGDDSIIGTGWLDMDDGPRIQGAHVDIGADESDGTSWPADPYVIVRVSPEGDDINDGSSWPLAKRTVQAGIDAASILGGEVWVKAGTYNERLSLREYVHLYGGFSGTETARDERDWSANTTTIDGGENGNVITAQNLGYLTSTIDGFVVRSGGQGSYGAVSCWYASPRISGNRVSGAQYQSAIRCDYSSPAIERNVLSSEARDGVDCVGGSPTIVGNQIRGNGASGIRCSSSSSAIMFNNRIGLNGDCGIVCDRSSPVIINNTLTGNGGSHGDGALVCTGTAISPSAPLIVSNLVAFNLSGICNQEGTPILRNNCVYGNTLSDYSGMDDPTGNDGNICADPGLAGVEYGNVHIQPDSPCLDAGDDSVVVAGWLDMDGEARIQGAHVDIGADESDGTTWPSGPYVIVRVSPEGDDANDGSTWPLAKKTVQAGIDAASSLGGEVWVKTGTYNERLSLREYVHLYGGFSGIETAGVERDCSANITTIDGGENGNVITARNLGYLTSTIDGFVVRNEHQSAGGVECFSSSPTISNSSISGTGGHGIWCWGSSPRITANTIAGNKGSGIRCDSSVAHLASNLIAANAVGGVYCVLSNPRIANCEVTANGSSGIYCDRSSPAITNSTITSGGAEGILCISSSSCPTMTNNIIAFNLSGICNQEGTPILRNNCVYGNTLSDYSGMDDPTGNDGNISVDPRLAGAVYGNVHIQPDSPCLDAGDDSIVVAGWLDMDGEARIQGAHVDIGADESDGTTWPSGPYVIVRVSPEGDDANDGSTWPLAKKTVQAGIDAASSLGGEVWVKTGTYNESVLLRPHSYLYGGFSGTEAFRSERDYVSNVSTVCSDSHECAAVTANAGNRVSRIDGFTLTNLDGDGIHCTASCPLILNNTITANRGTGLRCSYSSPIITNNEVIRNWSGMLCDHSSPIVSDNTIMHNYGSGVDCSYSTPDITRSNISANEDHGIECHESAPMIHGNRLANNFGDGIYCSASSPEIINNKIDGNGACGISCYESSPNIMHNTIVGNSGSEGGGVLCSGGAASPVLTNNMIVYNLSGIYKGIGAPILRNNCVYGNMLGNYSGMDDPTGTDGNISADPRLAGVEYGNVHIQSDSPCVDAGDDSVVVAGWLDMDCEARIQGAHVDIGADESDGTTWPSGPYVIVRVSPEGDDANDGSTWPLAKKTVQAGIDAAASLGGEVWVSGSYEELIDLRAYAHLYGGFSGTETTRNQRDLSYPTWIAGNYAGSVVSARGIGYRLSTLDGFTIVGGRSLLGGGGVYCYAGSSPRIANNVIRGNFAHLSNGAGISCTDSSPLIANNTIRDNYAQDGSYGGGIALHGGFPSLTHNVITGNNAAGSGGGVYCRDSSAVIERNSITSNDSGFSGGGVFCGESDSPIIANNEILNNDASNLGGGVAIDDSSATVSNNLICGNAADAGSGIDCDQPWGVRAIVADNTIVKNHDYVWHGALRIRGGSTDVCNNILAFNRGGIRRESGIVILQKNCVYGNTSVNYSGISPGAGDIADDPLFADLSAGDYHLATESPCVNAGSNDAPGLLLFDIDGEGRVFGSEVDIGADEYWSEALSMSDAKHAADGAKISGQNAIVTAAFPSFFYIEAEDRSSGIRVEKDAHGIAAGNRATITGSVSTNADGEKCILADGVTPGEVGVLAPLGLSTSRLGGGDWFFNLTTSAGQQGIAGASGLNNIGLLVKTWGKVTQVGEGYLYIDDGSGLRDGTLTGVEENVGVRVICDSAGYSNGEKVEVTGISSCFQMPSGLARRILTRGPNDVRKIGP